MAGRRWRLLVTVVVFACWATPAVGAIQTGQSGWSWSSPQPQGRGLLDIAAVDPTHAYAAGEFGTILSTADGGETWTSVPTGTTQSFRDVDALSAASFAASSQCGVRSSEDGGLTLRRVPFTTSDLSCTSSIVATEFVPGTTTGFILLTDGTVLRTQDGTTFSRRTSITGNGVDLLFRSETLGFATNQDGAIFRTADAGGSWTLVSAGGGFSPTTLTFASDTTAYAVGLGGIVRKSIDGGLTWPATPAPSPNFPLSRISCGSPTTCIATKDGSAQLTRTIDGGTSFTSVTPASQPINAVAFLSPTRVVAVGALGVVTISDDAGATWRQVGSRLAARLSGLRANADGFAYGIGNNGALATTSDFGATWREPGAATQLNVRSAVFVDHQVGYVVDSGGAVLRTANGGDSWQILDPGPDFLARAVAAPTTKLVVLLGGNGEVRRSLDAGGSFSTVRRAGLKPNARGLGRAGSALALYGARSIAISTTGGRTWRIVDAPKVRGAVVAIRGAQCTAPTVCWLTTTTDLVFRTTNGGRTWKDLTAGLGRVRAAHLNFRNAKSGYISLPSGLDVAESFGQGWVLRTADGGATWAPQIVSQSGPVQVASGGAIDYALDGAGNVFTTATGGQRGTASVLKLTASRTTIPSRTRVTLTGRLIPASGGERVIVSASDRQRVVVTVASNGRFSTSFTIANTTSFVAQWTGDAARAGDGSLAVTIRRIR